MQSKKRSFLANGTSDQESVVSVDTLGPLLSGFSFYSERKTMKRSEKLKQNWEFRRLYNRGKCVATQAFILYFAKGKHGRVRLGITAGKKIGTAVNRNRAKRVITAAFDTVSPNIKKGYDFVIVARGRILAMKSTQVGALLLDVLSENGLIDS